MIFFIKSFKSELILMNDRLKKQFDFFYFCYELCQDYLGADPYQL